MSERVLTEVIDEMLKHVPEDHSLRGTLTDIRGSAEYAPPESAGMWWQEVSAALVDEIAPEDPDDVEAMLAMDDWKKQVLMAFNPPMRKLFEE